MSLFVNLFPVLAWITFFAVLISCGMVGRVVIEYISRRKLLPVYSGASGLRRVRYRMRDLMEMVGGRLSEQVLYSLIATGGLVLLTMATMAAKTTS